MLKQATVPKKATGAVRRDSHARPTGTRRGLLCTRWTAAVALAWASLCGGIEIEQTQWGFDGRVCVRSFTMLNVLVSNPSPEAYEGMITLTRTDPRGERRGARLLQPCVLGPYGSRWLQFYPRVPDQSYQKWRLDWEGGKGSYVELPTPTHGPPAVVYLTSASTPSANRVPFRMFDAALFPPVLGATEGLHAVLLDHVPRWEASRRQSFMDWVRSGGIVHVCQGLDGRMPAFVNHLAELNSSFPRWRVGNGMVVRHAAAATALSTASLAAKGFPAPVLKKGEQTVLPRFDTPVLHRLSQCVIATHNWGLILSLTVAYLILLCPVNYIVGRQCRKGVVTLAFFGTAVVLFSVLFQIVGRRGYGESATVFTISRARPLDSGRYSVTQWSSAFVTRSNAYVVTHASPENLYATCQDMEAVNGIIRNGREGLFTVVMPLYSKRSFVHHGIMSGPNVSPTVLEWFRPNSETAALKLPELPDLKAAWLYRNGRFHAMQEAGEGILRTHGVSQDQDRFLDKNVMTKVSVHMGRRRFRTTPGLDPDEVTRQTMNDLMKPLIGDALGGTEAFAHIVRTPNRQDPKRGILFLFAESPDSFAAQGPTPLGRETGYTLYQIPVHAADQTGADPDEYN